jgi:DNA-directed RNA polymerase beta subunit
MKTFDVRQQFETIKKAATDAVRGVFPIEGKLRSLRLDGVTVEDKLEQTDYASQSEAKAKSGTWGVPVYAGLSLIDKQTGKAVNSAKVRLFLLPKITPRFSYIVGGNEYQVNNQLRLRSGVYIVKKQNGELKTMVNLAQGKNFDIVFDETKGRFSISKVAGGQANIPLYPILSYMGMSDQAIAQAWGSELLQANRDSDPKSVARAVTAFGIRVGDLKEYFSKTKLSPEMARLTLGEGFDKVSGPMMLAASKKLLNVHLAKEEPHDLNSLEYKELHSLDDFLKERLEKNRDTLTFKIKRSIDNLKRATVAQIVNPEAFNSTVESFFTQDDKSSTPEQTNPLEMASGQARATIMGSGGVTSEHAVTSSMREIHPTHYGFIDPVNTPESSRIGANLHLPLGARKVGKELKMVLADRNNKPAELTATQAFNAKIAFPGQKGDKVKVNYKGQTIEVPRKEVDYFTIAPEALFSMSTNLIPFLPSNQGNRAMMAAKMLEQAISLKHREAPLVQVSYGANSMEHEIGKHTAVTAPEDGTITKISKDFLMLKTKAGEQKIGLYNNFVLNRKSYLHHEVVVTVGQKVKKGQLLAESNFTKGGTLALGTNLRTAYLPYQGLNHDDGIVITEAAAEKLTSTHIHRKTLDTDDTTVLKLSTFKTQYPNALTPENLKKLDEDGVIRKGQKVEMGDAVIAALRRREPSKMIGVVQRQLADRPRDDSVYWSYDDTGEVIDVQRTSKGVTVFIRTEERAKIGDKLAGRHGNKGIITRIIKDGDAPRNAKGEAVDILLNPHGIISRINIGQTYESSIAKAAKKKGKPYVMSNFTNEDYLETTKKHLKDAGVDDKEELFDPVTGKKLGRVHVGNPYILKLFKLSQGNFSARQGGPGHPYDINLQPLKAGGEESSKSLDLLTMYSMLSHGARANLREMSTTKASQNDEYWKALKEGQQLPPPTSPFVYDKFMAYLRGAGIDVRKDGSKLTLAPLTDSEVKKLSSGEVTNPKFFRAKDKQPEKDGFLDPVKFGGFKGTKWGHINLKEPIVNPVFENAVRKLTGLGGKYDELMAGRLHLDKNGDLNKEGRGVTGGHAVEKLLGNIDVDAQLKGHLEKSKTAKGAVLDDLNKKIRYLMALKKYDLKPTEAYLRKTMPVVPPVYRPIYTLPDGSTTTSDVNLIYQNLAILNQLHKFPVVDMLPEEDKAMIRGDIYHHAKGISGLVDIPIKGRERAGFISDIKGGGAEGQPKEGFFISKMLSKRQDYAGRATAIPEPTLGVDELAIPEQMAWKVFEPFLVRELGRFGKTPNQALDEIKLKTELAKKALDVVMASRKVLLNRAPSLHKFSIMAFRPKLTSGTAVKVQPLINKGFGLDFDGDTVVVHVPISDEANREAEKMLPSRNLYQPGTGKLMMVPSQEAQVGLFYLSQTPAGRARLNKIIDKPLITETVSKKSMHDMLHRLSKELGSNEYGRVLTELKAEGEKHAFDTGFTLGLDDLSVMRGNRDKITKKVGGMTNLADANRVGIALLDSILSKRFKGKNNPLYDMVESGARGERGQLRQMLATPLFVTDASGKIVPSVIKKSYAEGLDIGDYWTSMYGARRGMMDRAIQTSLPGAFSKDIMASTIDNVISAKDCGTKKGVLMNVDSQDILERFQAVTNVLIDAAVANRLRKGGAKQVMVRSPLTCLQPKGTCAKCYGLDEHGHTPEVGENIGAKAGQTISEPLVQLVLSSFHTGGTAKTGVEPGGYKRIDQLLKMPKVVPGAAALAPHDGLVTLVTKGIAGGFDIYVGDKKVHVPHGRGLKVAVGARVRAGDTLSEGVVKPQDLVQLKGMQPAQEYVVDELHKAYSDQGVRIHRKVFETVVRSLGNTTRVLNNPKQSDFVPGDVVPYTVAQHYNENLVATVPVADAVGYTLERTYGLLRAGTVVGTKEVILLKALGHKEVLVKKDAIQHAPMLKSVTTLPLLKRNWMSALGYRNLAKALTEGAGQAWSTDLEDYHPVPAFAHGTTFGKGKDGKY